MDKNFKIRKYKGYDIGFNLYGWNEYSVFFEGDDVIFHTELEAMNFIDEQVKEMREFDEKIAEYNRFMRRAI